MPTENTPPLISLRQLDKAYGRRPVLRDLNLSIPKGSFFGLIGPNGSGKTTLLSLILGLVRPDRGEVVWAEAALDPGFKRKGGALIETPNFYPELSGWDNLGLLARIQGLEEEDRPRVLSLMGLMDRCHDKVGQYSLGMKQRLGMAAALLGSPDLLILDEPHNGMDPAGIRATRDLLRGLHEQGVTILLASHLLGEVEKVCTHLAVLHHGQLLAQGRRESLIPPGNRLRIQGPDILGIYLALRQWPLLDSVEKTRSEVRVRFRPPMTAARINQYCLDQGLELSLLQPMDEDLESYYLGLINSPSS